VRRKRKYERRGARDRTFNFEGGRKETNQKGEGSQNLRKSNGRRKINGDTREITVRGKGRFERTNHINISKVKRGGKTCNGQTRWDAAIHVLA